jgi:limonene-1,2-epoxide hydrolase
VNDSYAGHVLGPFIIAAFGLSLVSVPFVALALSRVRQADSGAASSVVNVAPLVGGSVGLAALGTVAWTTAAHQIHVTGAGGAAATYRHALATGFDRAFLGRRRGRLGDRDPRGHADPGTGHRPRRPGPAGRPAPRRARPAATRARRRGTDYRSRTELTAPHRRSQMESPIELVRRFCAAWSDNTGAAELAAFFTEDAVYHNIPQAPVTGRQNIATTIASFVRPGPPGIESIDFRVINIAANGPVVMTERVDVFKLPGKSFELPVMGTFEVSGGKISAWRDYFDTNQFTSRMG